MRRSALAAALVLLAAPAGRADPAARAPDLRLRALPPPDVLGLAMRRPTATAMPIATAAPARSPAPRRRRLAAADAADVNATLTSGYTAIPTTWRDVEERVIFHMNLGYGLDSAPLSGKLGRTGFDPAAVTDPNGNGFAENRQFLLGDAVVGSRGVLLPSLNTYFQSRFRFDANGRSSFTGLNDAFDTQNSRALLVNAGYAEIEGLGGEGSLLSKVFLRAGRQYRFGSNMYVANFDGVTAGYDTHAIEASGFFGQRVSLYFDDDKGVLGGAGLKLRGEALAGVPVDLTADYLYFSGPDLGDNVDRSRQFIELGSRVALPRQYLVYLRARLVDLGDLGDGTGLGRVSAQVRAPINRQLLVVGEAQRKFAGEVAYDYLSPVATDVVNVPDQIGLAFEPPQESTQLGLRADLRATPTLEVYGFTRVNLVKGSALSATNDPWQEAGAAVSTTLGGKVVASGQYKVRKVTLDRSLNQAGDPFDATAGSGISSFHELSGEARYRLGDKLGSAAIGAYYRVYNLRSPYAQIADDGRGGARFDLDYKMNRYTRARFAGEVAQPSPTLATDLSTLTSVRLILEAMF